MGWGRMMLLGNVGQQLDIGDLEGAITEMQGAVTDVQTAVLDNQRLDLDQAKGIAALRRENQDLKLYLATIVRLLVAKSVLKPEEVQTIVRAIEPER
ncbi:MAG TPA: hypothetical protein VFZ59_21780 [Verrucomicrobiae bacterium]|nr:hypothetical protein [Verrucomicrobiae bacterium]